jgi:RecB family exonuclease
MRIAVRTFDEPLMASRGIAAMLERSYRDVRDSGSTLADFARRGRRGVRNARRTELVTRAWGEYERAIASLNAIDPADLLLRATQSVDATLRPQLLAGFYDMTGAQRQLTEALLRAGRVAGVWIPTQEKFAQPFIQAMGAINTTPPLVPRASCLVTTYDTRLDELRGVCARVAELLAAGTPAREIGIVARSLEPYDARLLNRFAAEQGFRTTLTEEIPLAAHRIGRGALTLLRLRERGFPRAEVLGLLRDGLRIQTRIDADETDLAARRARIAGGTSEELRRMRTRSRAIEDYISLVAELETMPFDVTRFRLETDSDLAAAETLDEIATLVKRTAGATQADLIDAIEHATNRQPSTGNRQPVIWAGELLRFRGRSFPHLFAVRMQDDVFPQRRTEDPLLPDSDRRLLGIREIGDGRDEEQLLFSLLTQSAVSLELSSAAGDGFGKVLRPSRFVRSGGQAILPVSPVLKKRGQAGLPLLQRQLQLLVQSGTRSPFDGYIGPLDPEKLRALSPTQLEDFGECPQKFLLKHILRVEDIDHPERELQIHHRDKGILDHRILEELYRSLDPADFRIPLPEHLGPRLDALVDAHFDEHEAIAPPFNRTVRDIERRATKRILREFIAADVADLEASTLVPTFFEYRFGAKHRDKADHPEPFVVNAGGVPVHVEGTVDRIDAGRASARPTYRIVDYKSGKALRHVNLGDKIDRGVRLQLALYAMAVAEFFRVEAEHVSGTIKPIIPGETKPAKFAFALHEKRAALLETLELFIRAILSGTFPAFPNEDDDFNSCKYCPVNHSCRTRHDLDERYAVQQYKDPRTLLSRGAE